MNIPVYIIISIIGFIFLLCVVCYCLAKMCIKAKKEIRKLESNLNDQKRNIDYLIKHAEEIASVQQARKDWEKELREAKSDEEVVHIISTIIDANNKRMQESEKKGNGPSA